MLKIFIFMLFISVVSVLLIFLFACVKVASKCSEIEERRDVYTCIRNDSERS